MAFLALAFSPNFIGFLDGGGHDSGFIGKDAGLEIAAMRRFHPHIRTREVCAAHVADGMVNDDDLEVHPRAHHLFQHLGQSRVAVEAGTEVRPPVPWRG